MEKKIIKTLNRIQVEEVQSVMDNNMNKNLSEFTRRKIKNSVLKKINPNQKIDKIDKQKRNYIIKIASLVALFVITVGTVLKFSTPTPNDSAIIPNNESETQSKTDSAILHTEYGLKWIVPPTLDYEFDIFYHPDEDVFVRSIRHEDEDKYSLYSDDIDAKILYDNYVYEVISESNCHPVGEYLKMGSFYSRKWIFDEERELFGYCDINKTKDNLQLYPMKEFAQRFPDEIDTLKLVHSVDSSIPNFAYTNDSKTAIAVGNTLLTDFIYREGASGRYNDFYVSVSNESNKMGIADKNGDLVLPFCLDSVNIISNNSAFAVINGKYGIIHIGESIGYYNNYYNNDNQEQNNSNDINDSDNPPVYDWENMEEPNFIYKGKPYHAVIGWGENGSHNDEFNALYDIKIVYLFNVGYKEGEDKPIAVGVLDKNYNITVDFFQYSEIYVVSKHIYGLELDAPHVKNAHRKCGIISTKNEIIYPLIYDGISSKYLHDGSGVVALFKGDEAYLGDFYGNQLSEITWNNIDLYYDSQIIPTELNGEKYYLDLQFEIIDTSNPLAIPAIKTYESEPVYENLTKYIEIKSDIVLYSLWDNNNNKIIDANYTSIDVVSEDCIVAYDGRENKSICQIFNGKGELICDDGYDYIQFINYDGEYPSKVNFYNEYGVASIVSTDNSDRTWYVINRKGEKMSKAYTSMDDINAEWDLLNGKQKTNS